MPEIKYSHHFFSGNSFSDRDTVLMPAPHAKHRWYGLKPGQLLGQCSSGFTWNDTHSGIEAHVPYEVRVVKEYDAHIVVEAVFVESGKEVGRYTESINKCAVRGGYCYFLAVPEGV